MSVCKRVLVLVLVLDWTQMSPARSWRSVSHTAGSHDWLPPPNEVIIIFV